MQTIINVQNVAYTYPHGTKSVLDGVSFTIETGQILSLLGANGCGKSTLLKLLMRELCPSSGKVQKKDDLKIAYISQNIHQSLFLELTVQENLILMGIPFSNKKEAESYLKTFHRNLFLYFDQPVMMLSGGEKQALALAIKLYDKPDILLLDEHTSAMDPEAEKDLMTLTYQKITQQKITTLMSTHKINLARQYSTRIIGLNKGKIVIDLENIKHGLIKEHLDRIYLDP
jgi:ABC-type uncharacterized transport system ATPase component